MKRRRLHDGDETVLHVPALKFASFPIEIIAEILFHTRSLPTVLAVSRTCSFLYHSLAKNPDASFIWRRVRKSCKLPLPNPGDAWKSEADYAAFVYSGGVCEVCGKHTYAIYVSFAARIRLCGSWFCRKTFLSDHLVNVTTELQGQDPKSIWVPVVESIRCFYPSRFGALIWPQGELLFRKRDWEKFKRQQTMYNSCVSQAGAPNGDPQQVESFLEHCRKAKERLPQIMEVSISLAGWKWRYDQLNKIIKKDNKARTKKLVEREGWDLEDLLASQTYVSLLHRKTLHLETVDSNDVASLRSEIESELLTLQKRHKRQHAEATFREKSTEIVKVYERMRSGTTKGTSDTGTFEANEPWVLPPLPVFCALPSVRALKGSPDPSALPPSGAFVSSDINSPLALSLISTDVHNWLVPVEKHLMTLLGYPNGWQSASKHTVPPLKRVTARFLCRRCGGRGGKVCQRSQCLDFRGVCAHVCAGTQKKRSEDPSRETLEGPDTSVDHGDGQDKRKNKKKRKRGAKASDWDVNVFEKDDKAIALVNTILRLANIPEDSPRATTMLRVLGGSIRCTTCTGWVVMDFDTAVRHAHRHTSMQIKLLPLSSAPRIHNLLLPQTEGKNPHIPISALSFERGTAELLLGRSYRGKGLHEKVNYGCKHCFVDEAGWKEIKFEGPRPLNFNALRSHAKDKHGIQCIGDEDFFCFTKLEI